MISSLALLMTKMLAEDTTHGALPYILVQKLHLLLKATDKDPNGRSLEKMP